MVPELEAAICTVEVPAGVTLEGLVGVVGAVDWDAELPVIAKANVPAELTTCNGTDRWPEYPGLKVTDTLQMVLRESAVLRSHPVVVAAYSCFPPCDTAALILVIVVPPALITSGMVTAALVAPTAVVGKSTLPRGVFTSRTRLLFWSEK